MLDSELSFKDEQKTDVILDRFDLKILESALQFNIERIESGSAKLSDAERQSLKALVNLKEKINRIQNEI